MIRNPILPGFYPDPSVCRVGCDYYLVTSTFEYFPGVPIFHSTDLVNWTQIGHCLTRLTQLSLDRTPPSSGIYAPTLRYHDGTFYMITTNVDRGGNFFITATDPAGPWSDPIWIDSEMIDPSLLFDDDGTVYYTRRTGDGIVQAEINIETGDLLTDLRLLVHRFIAPDMEGPHLYKINGLYYLMAAEGGTRYGHAEVIGRSESPWGPFEPCPFNPIVTHRDQGHGRIRDVGHGELVEDHNGNWWFFCLGTRHAFHASAGILGRETFLAPVTWTDDGWPVIGENGTIPETFETPLLPDQTRPADGVWRDEFNTLSLDLSWNFLRAPQPAHWSLRARPDHLRLMGSDQPLSIADSPTFIGRRQQHFNMEAACLLDFDPTAGREEAGLTVYVNHAHHYDLMITRRDDQRCVVLRKTVGDMADEQVSGPIAPGPVELTIASEPGLYRFAARDADGMRHNLGSGLTRLIAPEVAHDHYCWTGAFIALFASGNGQACRAPADVTWFEYRYSEEM
ncbi:MAG: glycoside hydrolase family 43 protein [Anaerolineae bacterium]|nr:glycoside hydrolase family 43 protein [Anaerolineae bacterium]